MSNLLSPGSRDPEPHSSTAVFEMAGPILSRTSSRQQLLEPAKEPTRLAGLARHTLGLILLLFVVFLWTLSNFLGSVRSPETSSKS